ncbi:MAG: hypothetical protein ACI9U2_002491 [Bradymonadia bacterium]|jgi:hypothetical protein
MRSPIRLCLPLLSVLLLPDLARADPPQPDAPAAPPAVSAPPSTPAPPVVSPAPPPVVSPAPPPVVSPATAASVPVAAPAVPIAAPASELAPTPDQYGAQMHLELSIFGRYTPQIDLAELASAPGQGSANDAAFGGLGLQLSVGVEYAPFEFGIDLGRAAGGLDAAKIDSRYFNGRDPAAQASTHEAGLRLWWVHAAHPDFQWLMGPHARWLIHTSESGISRAQLNAFGVGGQLGFRWRTNRISELVDGALRVVASAHGNLPTGVSLRQASGDLLFAESSPEGIFFDFGLSIGYGITFR